MRPEVIRDALGFLFVFLSSALFVSFLVWKLDVTPHQQRLATYVLCLLSTLMVILFFILGL